MKVYLVWYTSIEGLTGLWNIYANEELALQAKDFIEKNKYGTDVAIYPEEVMTSV